MDVKRLANMWPGTTEQYNAARALKPSEKWAPVNTNDMIESSAWPGQQIRALVGSDKLIQGTLPDVVDDNLEPTVFPQLRWIRVYDEYCKALVGKFKCSREQLDGKLRQEYGYAADGTDDTRAKMGGGAKPGQIEGSSPPAIDGVTYKKPAGEGSSRNAGGASG